MGVRNVIDDSSGSIQIGSFPAQFFPTRFNGNSCVASAENAPSHMQLADRDRAAPRVASDNVN